VPGKAKTRLIPMLGERCSAAGAADAADTVGHAKAAGLMPELCATPEPGDPEWAGSCRGGALSDQGEATLASGLRAAVAAGQS
jgi:hypothetical protein